jgi:predicted GH43/DUF377 family glycosyl hydrolase
MIFSRLPAGFASFISSRTSKRNHPRSEFNRRRLVTRWCSIAATTGIYLAGIYLTGFDSPKAMAAPAETSAPAPSAIPLVPPAPLPAWTLGPFLRPDGLNPIIQPQPNSLFNDPITQKPVKWEALHTFNPAAVVKDGKIYVLYRAEDDSGEMNIGRHTSRLGLAESEDGLHFKRSSAPVFYPDEDAQKENEWPGGCEDPRIAETEDGTYVLTYTQWNRKIFRIGVATSRDLVHWTKHGHAFAKAYDGKYANLRYKSSGIVTQVKDGRLIAAKIKGKYWLFWGEGKIRLATSDDLINWQPLEDENGKLVDLIGPRPGKFDSVFPEVGPPPILTKDGILLLYNGKNGRTQGDPRLGPDAYAAGQALFDAQNPQKLFGRLDEPFFKPELPFEMRGQYKGGTTFVEGLTYFKGKWFLYYGCADSFVGVAVHDPKTNIASR